MLKYRDRAAQLSQGKWKKLSVWLNHFQVRYALKDTDALVWDLGQNFDYKTLLRAIPLIPIFKIEDVLLKQKSVVMATTELDTFGK